MNIFGQQHLSVIHVRYVTKKFIVAIGYDIFLLCAKNRIHYITIQDLGLPRPSASTSFLSEVEVDGPAASKGNPGFADLGKRTWRPVGRTE
jgi:hypothetical protein